MIGRQQVKIEYQDAVIDIGSELLGVDLEKKARLPAIQRIEKNINSRFKKQELLEIVGITRQAIYKKKLQKTKVNALEMDILRRVNEMRALHPRMDPDHSDVALGLKQIGITKFEQFMSRYGLTVNVKRKRIITTKNGPGTLSKSDQWKRT